MHCHSCSFMFRVIHVFSYSMVLVAVVRSFISCQVPHRGHAHRGRQQLHGHCRLLHLRKPWRGLRTRCLWGSWFGLGRSQFVLCASFVFRRAGSCPLCSFVSLTGTCDLEYVKSMEAPPARLVTSGSCQ